MKLISGASTTTSSFLLLVVSCGLLVFVPTTSAFGNGAALFQEHPTEQKLTFQSQDVGVDIELPDFDELFHRIKEISPLSRVAMEKGMRDDDNDGAQRRGFDAIDENCEYHSTVPIQTGWR